MKKILGIIGRIGAGKDTASDYIAEKYGFEVIAFRDIVKEVTEKEGLEANRENMQKVGKRYRDEQGQEVFTKLIFEKIQNSTNEKILVKEMRTTADIKFLIDNLDNMKVLQIVTNKDNRYLRLKERGRSGDPESLGDFEEQENKEEELGYTKALDFTDVEVDNNGTIEELNKKLDDLV